jgi:hypothetical protein
MSVTDVAQGLATRKWLYTLQGDSIVWEEFFYISQ